MINIQKNVPLAQFTTFKIGGPAKFFVEASNSDEVIEAVRYAKENRLEIFVLSGGSNILVSDKGFDGLVLKFSEKKIEIAGREIKCSSGAKLSEVVLESARNGLTGLEWAIGVPGNVGGAVRGNAGCYGGEIGRMIEFVNAVDMESLEKKTFSQNECRFSYRSSFFKENPKFLITSVGIKLEEEDKVKIQEKIKEIVRKRVNSQPKDPSAGSFFKNPVVENKSVIEEFENETGATVKNGIVPAGWIIESLGLKGKKMGGAQISEKHANFIVNVGDATASDVIMLSSYIKQQARDEMNIQFQEEIQLVGF